MSQYIVPRYKLMLFYDIVEGQNDAYYDFIMSEFLPAAGEMGLYIFRVFHTAWGDWPMRQAEFVCEDLGTLRDALKSERWQELESRLQQHITNYQTKIVAFKPGFQM